MRLRLPALAAATLALAACGGGGAGGGGLAYAVPGTPTVTYAMEDETLVDIDAMGQTMQMSQSMSGTMTASFARAANGVEVTLTVDDYEGRLAQPMGAPITANENGIDGPMVFTLDAMGNVTVGSLPDVSGNAEMLFQPLGTVYGMFPGLPGGAVATGDMWTDTVSYSGPTGAGEVEVMSITEYTVVGDTVVDGRTLMKFDLTGNVQSGASNSVQGMDVYQSINADFTGHLLWDAQAGVMFERVVSTEGSGSLEVSMAPQAMGMAVRGSGWIRIAN